METPRRSNVGPEDDLLKTTLRHALHKQQAHTRHRVADEAGINPQPCQQQLALQRGVGIQPRWSLAHVASEDLVPCAQTLSKGYIFRMPKKSNRFACGFPSLGLLFVHSSQNRIEMSTTIEQQDGQKRHDAEQQKMRWEHVCFQIGTHW